MEQTVFLFGEAGQGEFCTPKLCRSLPQLADTFGHPPEESQGLFYGIQTLLYERELIFFRVKEEGYSVEDYLKGIRLLERYAHNIALSAICMPGVGDSEIIDAITPICSQYKSLLVLGEKDLFDYLIINGSK